MAVPDYHRRMNDLLSWSLVVAATLALVALGFNALQVISSRDEFRIAIFWFISAGLVLMARIVFWAITTSRSTLTRAIVCIFACGLVFTVAIEAVRYVNRKHGAWEEKIRPSVVSAISPPTAQVVNKSESAEIIFEFLKVRQIKLERVHPTHLWEGWKEAAGKAGADGVSVVFRNTSNRSLINVAARVSFYDQSGAFIYQVNRADWLDEIARSRRVSPGEKFELLLICKPARKSDLLCGGDTIALGSGDKMARVDVAIATESSVQSFSFKLCLKPKLNAELLEGAKLSSPLPNIF